MKGLNRWTKVAIVGARDFDGCGFVFSKVLEVLERLDLNKKEVLVVTGDARGVDECARGVASLLKVPLLVFFADWKKYGKSAGPIRNSYIAEVADIVIAFPSKKSRGTWDTVSKAKKLGKKVYIFKVQEVEG